MIEVEELFALAFIFTISVAFQGLFIFIIFVLLQKPVRDSYAIWWKAKVVESDFLSKHFGEKMLTSSSTLVNLKLNVNVIAFAQYFLVQMSQRSAPSQEANVAAFGEKFELSQETINNSCTEDGPVHDEEKEKPLQDLETYFNGIFIMQPDSAADVKCGFKGEKKVRI